MLLHSLCFMLHSSKLWTHDSMSTALFPKLVDYQSLVIIDTTLYEICLWIVFFMLPFIVYFFKLFFCVPYVEIFVSV